jgi:hypothetical protein
MQVSGSIHLTPTRVAFHRPLALRTFSPIESRFAGVRLRTDVARRMRRRENAPYLVFKIAQRHEHSWRPLNGGVDGHDPAAGRRSLR